MNRMLAVAFITLVLVAPPVAADDSVGVVEGERGSLESFFYGVWSRLKALSPRTEDARVGSSVIATAGLRGADDDNLQMEPYWKGDISQDAAFQQQIDAYRSAIEQGEQGNTAALQSFLDQYGDSDLAANVQFGLAIAKVRAGKRDAARGELERFIDRYPEHPLVADAEALLQRLSS